MTALQPFVNAASYWPAGSSSPALIGRASLARRALPPGGSSAAFLNSRLRLVTALLAPGLTVVQDQQSIFPRIA